ncbi:MAG: ferritin [Gammaproteobacteria bacterium]|nr:ferritin [Gammaproteobacteria bacterium]
MISKMMAKRLNDQLNKEFYSAYLYLSISALCGNHGFNGAANWFFIQYQEETAHALKMFRYLNDQNVDIDLRTIFAPELEDLSFLGAFEASLEHEKKMTHQLNELSGYSFQEKDHATYNFLQWYVTEQVEEEAALNQIIDQIRIVGDNGHGLLTIDKELGARIFVDPTI